MRVCEPRIAISDRCAGLVWDVSSRETGLVTFEANRRPQEDRAARVGVQPHEALEGLALAVIVPPQSGR